MPPEASEAAGTPSAALVAAWLRAAALAVNDRAAWLTELDAAIGDGDHGINLDRGFGLVVVRLDAGELPSAEASSLLTGAGRSILGSVGGASGALYGRGLIRAGEALAGAEAQAGAEAGAAARSATGRALVAVQAAVDGIAALGRAAAGDKTMLDALLPAVEALRQAEADELDLVSSLGAAARAAASGAAATTPLQARRGRASYLGERSVGHLDPGAASAALLLETLAEVAARSAPAGGPRPSDRRGDEGHAGSRHEL